MVATGSIMLIAGIAGIVSLLAVLTFRPRLFSRGLIAGMLIGLFLIAATGLVILTAFMDGQSLHTGG